MRGGGAGCAMSWTGQLLLVGTCPAALLAALAAVCCSAPGTGQRARVLLTGVWVTAAERGVPAAGSVLQQCPGAFPCRVLCSISAAGPDPTLLG